MGGLWRSYSGKDSGCLCHRIPGDPRLLCIAPCGLGGSVLREAQCTEGAVGISDTPWQEHRWLKPDWPL